MGEQNDWDAMRTLRLPEKLGSLDN